MGSLSRVAVAVRMLALVVLVPVSVLVTEHDPPRATLLLGVVVAVATGISALERVPQHLLAALEAAAVAVLAVLTVDNTSDLAAYVVVPLFLAGFSRRLRGLAVALGATLVAGAVAWLATGLPTGPAVVGLLVWAVAGAVAGAVGVLLHRRDLSRTSRDAEDASYRDAIGLIQQLDELSGRLTEGLDPVTLAEEMMAEADVSLPVERSAVFTRSTEGEVIPLRYSTFAAPRSFGGLDDFVETTWASDRPLLRATTAGVPLRTGARTEARTVAVMVLELAHPVDQRALAKFQQSMAGSALRLQAALLFDNVRAHATSEERNRLAREVHDGVAQDVASLGYMVDGLAAGATTPDQQEHLVSLRTEVTRVVAELRASVYDLRNEMRAGQGLGQGVSAFARQIGSRSDLTVHVRLDEGATRLRPDIEAELLRIAQEAMNNARKHSGGRNLWVSCTVRPPYAEIEVLDDGAGLKRARHDSHGLRIMRERAESIGAQLDVESLSGAESGTRLRVRLGAE